MHDPTSQEFLDALTAAWRRSVARVLAEPGTMDEAQARVLDLLDRCRDSLPVKFPHPRLEVTAEPLTEEDRQMHRLRFTIRPEPMRFDLTINLDVDEG